MPRGMRLVAVYMPSLLQRFTDAEKETRAPLAYLPARRIRNEAVAVLVPGEIPSKIQQRRAFRDLNPDHFWTDWQRLRDETSRPAAISPGWERTLATGRGASAHNAARDWSRTCSKKSASAWLNAHGRGEADGLAVQAAFADEQAEVFAGFHDLGTLRFGRFLCSAIFNEFDAKHEAFATHIADDIVFFFERFESGHEVRADLEASWPEGFPDR